jgi:hypothetical protein
MKQSQFTKVETLGGGDYIPAFGQENKAIKVDDFLAQARDEIVPTFIYKTIALLQAADLEIDNDRPIYVRCEETEYRLYKITNAAAGVDDITLNNGATATFQVEYRDIGFVIGPDSSTARSIALFKTTDGAELEEGPVITDIGEALVSIPSSSNKEFFVKNTDNSVSMLQAQPFFDQVKQNATESYKGVVEFASSSETLDSTVSDKSLTPANADLLLKTKTALTVNTFSELATTAATVAGMVVYLKQHTSGMVGGGYFQDVSGTATNDGGLTINNTVTSGRRWVRIGYETPLAQFWGAIGDGVNDDTAAVQLAINSGAKCIHFPAGNYLIGAAGLTGVSNQSWAGCGVGITKITASAIPTLDFIKFSAKSNFFISGITFDANAKLTAAGGGSYPNLLPLIYTLNCSFFEITNCEFVGFYTAAIVANICHDYKINHNVVTRTGVLASVMNYGISLPGGVGSENYNGDVMFNTLTRCDIGVNGSNIKVNFNTISGWGFSSGIDFVVDGSCHDNEAIGNIIKDSNQAPDRDGFYPCGIENWSKNTVISGNIISGMYGDAIENGGKNCTITNNQGRNNGSSGLYNLYQDATYNASGTVADGNIFINNSQYGFREQSSSLTGMIYGRSNILTGNTSGKFNILSSSSEYYDSGSITLDLIGATTSGSQSFSKNSFDWVREGLKVTITGRLQLSAISGTGQVRITGLPFASRNTSDLFGTFAIQYSGFATSYVSIVGLVNQGQSYVTLTGNTAAATGNTSVQMSNLSSTALICFTATYLI